jgi:staphylococcal nuclease domain-containing protein 1
MVSHSFSSTATPAPAPPATAFIVSHPRLNFIRSILNLIIVLSQGSIQHPAGNIAALLVGTGLVRIVDWHAGFLRDAMPELRKAESSAKASRVGHWRNLPAPVTSTSSNGTTVVVEKIKSFEGVVTRVWGADLLSILPNGSNEERRIQFASIRQPK